MRVVPFAYNGTSAQTAATASLLFANNFPGIPPALPTIHLYTVPAYVAPVTFNIGALTGGSIDDFLFTLAGSSAPARCTS